jgi:hypothetical protein
MEQIPVPRPEFLETFSQARALLKKQEKRLVVQHDKPGNYYLNTRVPHKSGGPMFFGAVTIR